jgi:hypothetical protein
MLNLNTGCVTLCCGLQVVLPNPANKEVYARLLEQHIQQGERLFGKA